mmetsp:Transcript_21337/g.54494  ORF Transcript_21337/g.54494 Transcript_21337/m.54494 type:complete len:223 (-) Transcript_21337:261-929(-)
MSTTTSRAHFTTAPRPRRRTSSTTPSVIKDSPRNELPRATQGAQSCKYRDNVFAWRCTGKRLGRSLHSTPSIITTAVQTTNKMLNTTANKRPTDLVSGTFIARRTSNIVPHTLAWARKLSSTGATLNQSTAAAPPRFIRASEAQIHRKGAVSAAVNPKAPAKINHCTLASVVGVSKAENKPMHCTATDNCSKPRPTPTELLARAGSHPSISILHSFNAASAG